VIRRLSSGAGIGGLTNGADAACPRIAANCSSSRIPSRYSASASTTLRNAIRDSPASGYTGARRHRDRTESFIISIAIARKSAAKSRGIDAGHDVPQFSIHRGRLQSVITGVEERLGRMLYTPAAG